MEGELRVVVEGWYVVDVREREGREFGGDGVRHGGGGEEAGEVRTELCGTVSRKTRWSFFVLYYGERAGLGAPCRSTSGPRRPRGWLGFERGDSVRSY